MECSIIQSMDEMILDSSIEDLCTKDNIVLIRSAKDDVMQSLLEHLSHISYNGNLFLIGRQDDEKWISKYPDMNIDLYIVDDNEMYTVENTKEYIDKVNVDAVCFLYQKKVSSTHDNLIEIIEYANCRGYAISRQLRAIKFDTNKMKHYRHGKSIYEDLCSWYYDSK